MKIYLAAKFERREELMGISFILSRNGFPVVSRWVDGTHERQFKELSGQFGRSTEADIWFQAKVAGEDIDDISSADMIVLFTEKPYSKLDRGGRHTEFGIARGLKKILVVVGPRENVFHYTPDVYVFSNFENFIQALKGGEIH